MEASSSDYDYEESRIRIDEILNSADSNYEDKKSVPNRNQLTFNNGFNVDCASMFIDIRESKSLSNDHTKPVLAKIYKTYISESIAVFRQHSKIKEISIEGDSVWGVFDTPYKSDIDEIIEVCAKLCSLIDTLNIKLKKKGYSQLRTGIGVSYGSSLLIKSGYRGSGINEVVWIGKVVGEASELCSYGKKSMFDKRVMVCSCIYSNMKESYKEFFNYSSSRGCYEANIIDSEMNDWVVNNG